MVKHLMLSLFVVLSLIACDSKTGNNFDIRQKTSKPLVTTDTSAILNEISLYQYFEREQLDSTTSIEKIRQIKATIQQLKDSINYDSLRQHGLIHRLRQY